MRLMLQVLDGPKKGTLVSLRKDLTFRRKNFDDDEMFDKHATLTLDEGLSWNIKALGSAKIRAGALETGQLALIQGLVFHLGQTGFKVVEKPQAEFNNWEEALIEWIDTQNWELKNTEFYFFLYPIRLTFTHGPQVDEFYTLSYGPREMGFNNIDINLKDPAQPNRLVRFYQIGEQTYAESLDKNKVLVNGRSFNHHPIKDGDRLQCGMNIIELTLLK